MNESAIRDAIWDWVNKATGLSDERLFWEGQRTPASNDSYVTLALNGIVNDGMDERVYTTLETPTEEADLAVTLRGPRDLVLTIQAHNLGPVGSNANTQLLNKVISYIGFPSVQAFFAGKLGIGPITPIVSIPGSESEQYDPRASVDVNIHAVSSFNENVASIQHVEVTNQISDTVRVIPPEEEP